MNFFVNLFIVIVVIISATNCTISNNDSTLQPHIDSLLVQLESKRMDAFLYWNLVTLQTCANDYDKSIAAIPDQNGVTTTRAFAIIHGAIYESVAVLSDVCKPVYGLKNIPYVRNGLKKRAISAAIMESAYQTLSSLYPKQQEIFDAIRDTYLEKLRKNENNGAAIDAGILVGKSVAQYFLTSRQNDGSEIRTNYTPTLLPGYHRADPTHPNQGFAAPHWGSVRPFLINSGSQFRASSVVGSTPEGRLKYLNSSQYIKEFQEVKLIGSKTSTVRTNDQTEIGIFWAYDGGLKVGVASRLYNQIIRVVAIKQKNTLEENVKLFALANYAMADVIIAAWDTKYFYNFWRPIVGIRLGSALTPADPNWLPLGSPADNAGTDFTPPFPGYVSGHSVLGSAAFETLRLFYKTDSLPFKFQSDEFNGKTVDSNTGEARPERTRHYQTFTQAEMENYLSRIYIGVHWRIDQEEGKIMGRRVAKLSYNKFH